MISPKQLIFLLCVVGLSLVLGAPDSAGKVPLPAPGLSYGGIPYGSVSGNVGEYYNNRQAPSSVSNQNGVETPNSYGAEPNYAPGETWGR